MSNNKYKILVVEDDHNIASFIQAILEANDFQVLTAQRCRQGMLMVNSHMPDLVVLDLGLPDLDGMDVIRQIRAYTAIPILVISARTQEKEKVMALDGEEFIRVVRQDSMVPILVLSARSEEQDKVSALDLGANDYITKPFGTAELLARVRAALRVSRHRLEAAASSGTFAVDDLLIDYDRRQVTVGESWCI